MRLDAQTGKLVATNDDYRIPVNTLDVQEVGDLVVFRVLTDKQDLYAAAIGKSEPDAAIKDVGAMVIAQARTDGHAVQVRTEVAV